MRCALAVAAIGAVLLTACGDGARDAGFRGRPLGRIRGLQLDDPNRDDALVDRAGGGSIRGGILWSVAGADALLDERGVLALHPEGAFDLDVYAPPPERALRPAARGEVALGQIAFYRDDGDGARDTPGANDGWVGRSEMLIAWTPAGASGGIVLGELAPGLHIVRPSVPCDVSPLFVYEVRPDDPLEVRLVPELAASALFGDPGCAAALDGLGCVPLAATRWWCRDGPATAERCDRCEYLLFPREASVEDCDAWYAGCVTRSDSAHARARMLVGVARMHRGRMRKAMKVRALAVSMALSSAWGCSSDSGDGIPVVGGDADVVSPEVVAETTQDVADGTPEEVAPEVVASVPDLAGPCGSIP